jgi:hypothetical protein
MHISQFFIKNKTTILTELGKTLKNVRENISWNFFYSWKLANGVVSNAGTYFRTTEGHEIMAT